MSKIEINYDALRIDCKEKLDNACSTLLSNVNKLNEVVLDEDFESKEKFETIKEELNRCYTNLSNVNNRVGMINDDLDKLDNSLQIELGKLPKSNLSKRSNIL